jgi:Zn-dependent protease
MNKYFKLVFNKSVYFALATFFIYSWLVSWKAALLIMAAIGWHELCHLWAAKRIGLKTKGFLWIPMIGGVSFIDEKYKTYKQQIIVVLAGPLGGCLLAVVPFAAYLLTAKLWFATAAAWILWLNAANLCPFSFLDGGQLLDAVVYSINKKVGFYIRVVSTMVGTVVISYFNIILAFLIGLVGGNSIGKEWRNIKYFEAGKTFLCSDDFLNKPEKLTVKQIVIVLSVWMASFALMAGLYICLTHRLHLNIWTLFGGK